MDPISFRKKKSIPIVVLCLGEWKNYLVIEKVDIKTEHEYFFIKTLYLTTFCPSVHIIFVNLL